MTQPTIPERVADETAQRLLERAAALDADGSTLAHLRQAATEAGISAAAFDAAVAEWRAASVATRAARPRVWHDRLLRHLGSFAAGGVALVGLTTLQRLVDAPWLVHKLTDPLSLAIGALVAVRLRAPGAIVVLGGLSIALGTEFLADVFTGAPAIRGFGAHMALMIAGIAGMALGYRLWGRRSDHDDHSKLQPNPAAGGGASATSSAVDLTNAEADKRFMERLRLRRNPYETRLQLS